jgi:nicotinamidase-related amidase
MQTMQNKALVVIDIQNDITKNYKEIISNINAAVDWTVSHDLPVVYIRHYNLSAGTRNFKPDTPGAELASDLKVASENIFDKSKSNALTSEAFASYLSENKIDELFICGADATVCVKSTCFNLRKAGYEVTVLSDCITSWDKKKLPEMIAYYEKQGCKVITLAEL